MEKLLIIDDEEAICSSLAFALEDEYRVRWALSSAAALQLLEGEEFGLVLLDLRLGDADGLDLLQEIRQKWPETLVIIMTAYGTIRSSVEAMRAGAFYYVTKPIELGELRLLLARAREFLELNGRVDRLREELLKTYNVGGIVGRSPAMARVFDLIHRVKDINSNVLITGESGTGKELVARAIHFLGNRREHNFEVINCAAIPRELLEAELFGYERGAFSGAFRSRKGRFLLANQGTLFLDEIAELDLALQAKILRLIQDKEVVPLGSNDRYRADVRIIAATNRDLPEAVRAGQFREDLYYRLNVISIAVPPLRERKEDIPLLVKFFLEKYTQAFGRHVHSVAPEVLLRMKEYVFPGNVRELENMIERAVALARGQGLRLEDFPLLPSGARPAEEGARTRSASRLPNGPNASPSSRPIIGYVGETLETLERRAIEITLESYGGNRRETARVLGISERGLREKLRRWGKK
ncbi:MAG: sigma-54 dependent transcriptional regulator [Firmicutes bacterium]|nr:sigma-54 dependent transcriptional regulator [Bacillota bacterium]